jgi:hypothetical protein
MKSDFTPVTLPHWHIIGDSIFIEISEMSVILTMHKLHTCRFFYRYNQQNLAKEHDDRLL